MGVKENNDDDMISYEETRQLPAAHPETNALFVVSSGAYGRQAVLTMNRRDIVMIVFDTIPSTIRMMRDHVIQCTIYQHPHQQNAVLCRSFLTTWSTASARNMRNISSAMRSGSWKMLKIRP